VAGVLAVLLTALVRRPDEDAAFQNHLSAAERALNEGRASAGGGRAWQGREVALRQGGCTAGLGTAWPDPTAPRGKPALPICFRNRSATFLNRATHSQEEEWRAQFEKRYRGAGQTNAVVFDAEVRRDGAGQYHLDWELRAGEEPARLEIKRAATPFTIFP